MAGAYGAGPHYPNDFDHWIRDGTYQGPIVGKWVHYHEMYERHFSRFRGKPVVLTEIGIKDGGSLSMWRRYFGSAARLFGADVYPGSRTVEGDARFGQPERVVVGDQGSESFWRDLENALPEGKLDILIDDGSHHFPHMIMGLERTLPLLRPGGVYVCEDILGSASKFVQYLVGRFVYNRTARATLNAFVHGHRVATNPVQREVFALTLYPYAAVVEKMVTPRRVMGTIQRGSGGINGSRHYWRTGSVKALKHDPRAAACNESMDCILAKFKQRLRRDN